MAWVSTRRRSWAILLAEPVETRDIVDERRAVE